MGTPAEERPSRYSTAAFVIRLVTSIVVPVALIGSVLWWFVARDQLDQAVERRAVTAAALVADVVGNTLGRPVAVDAHPKHVVAMGAAQMANHAARVNRYIDKYGFEKVEKFIDACLSVEDLIDHVHGELVGTIYTVNLPGTVQRRRADVSRY